MAAVEEIPQLKSPSTEEIISRDTPKLVAVLKEMKDGLEVVKGKVQLLTEMVKENQYPTVDGISYLEAKHLLLFGYCQNIVYYLLRKAKGMAISGHPLVQSLVEIRLFLEKIRPIDKKVEYEVKKLMKVATTIEADRMLSGERKGVDGEDEDLLKYRPNPDSLVSKTTQENEDDALYRPPRFAPTAMDDNKITKEEKQARRKDREVLRRAKNNTIIKEIMDDIEGRPEEIKEYLGSESREFERHKEKWEERARQEEELFVRAPISKQEKKRERYLLKKRDGLLGLTDTFYNEIGTFDDNEETPSYKVSKSGRKSSQHRKRH